MNQFVRRIKTKSNLGNKWAIRILSKNEFWKCIGCIIWAVTYEKKGYRIWGKIYRSDKGKKKCLIKRDASGKTYFQKVSCLIYRLN